MNNPKYGFDLQPKTTLKVNNQSIISHHYEILRDWLSDHKNCPPIINEILSNVICVVSNRKFMSKTLAEKENLTDIKLIGMDGRVGGLWIDGIVTNDDLSKTLNGEEYNDIIVVLKKMTKTFDIYWEWGDNFALIDRNDVVISRFDEPDFEKNLPGRKRAAGTNTAQEIFHHFYGDKDWEEVEKEIAGTKEEDQIWERTGLKMTKDDFEELKRYYEIKKKEDEEVVEKIYPNVWLKNN